MAVRVVLRREVELPNRQRVLRAKRLPEHGPRILFFSGGTALRQISRQLKLYTHNSIHLIHPFDSGGSSGILRSAFDMLSVGDLRNRLMALADETVEGNPAVYRLFVHRLSADDGQTAGTAAGLKRDLESFVAGTHTLTEAIPVPMRNIICTHLSLFMEHMPEDFDLSGASIGNLILTGGYLSKNNRDINTVLFHFGKLVNVLGIVRPTTVDHFHLKATHRSSHGGTGGVTVGQHLLGKTQTLHRGPIVQVSLVENLEDGPAADSRIDPISSQLITTADCIVYPIGSFFGSVLANLLPRGVGAAVVNRLCPKVYIPNPGHDAEMDGHTVASCVEQILALVRKDAGDNVPATDILQYVLVDTHGLDYSVDIDHAAVEASGVELVDVRLTKAGGSRTKVDPTMVAEILISLG